MRVSHITPILNVSNMQESFEWFEKLGWSKGWEWGDPVGFGGVCTGEVEIFLCLNAQGGKGRGTNTRTFGDQSAETLDSGVWLSLWVENVDEIHAHCVANEIEVTWPPSDMPWRVREMHVRHPDGHVFRISQALDSADGSPGV